MALNKNAATGFIFITVLIDVIGFGIIIPVMPKLISDLKQVPVNEAAEYGSWLMSTYAIMQFIFSPVVGGLSDKFGRRKILLVALLAFAVDYIFLALAPTYEWLFIGRIISGITGASFTVASAYIADISTPQTRAKNFGMIGMAFGLGFIIGPLIGGLLGKFGVRVPFYGAAILCLLNWIYGYFILPESLAPENRRPFDFKRSNPLGAIKQVKKYPAMYALFACIFLIYMAAQSVQAPWSYFCKYRFSWSEDQIGISLAVVGFMVALVQGVLIRFINPKLGNEKSLYIGLLFYSAGLLMFAFASQGWMMYAFTVVYCIGGLAGPAIQSLMAAQVPPNAQGELQGIVTSIMSVTMIFGPLLMNYLFTWFTRTTSEVKFPGAAFFAGFIFMLASAAVAYFALHKKSKLIPANDTVSN
jgi:MFS transporter, DHA1 family, tetracycline resistance protein